MSLSKSSSNCKQRRRRRRQSHLLLFIQKSALREKERDLAARTMNTFGALRQMHF
jgi:hypothetical protein